MTREEAIEVVRKNWPDASFTRLREALETLIPELAESEDEKIRNRIIEYLKQDIEEYPEREERINEMLAYLEKQKPVGCSEDFAENIRVLLTDKLTWHSPDGKMSSTVLIDDRTLKDIVSGIWFYVGKEALKYPKKEFNAVEWSEEDKTIIEGACNALEIHGHTKLANLLKSLRPQPKQDLKI